jgi:photosystem II stability/assembly factor-like uncharacterized protein
MKTKGLYIAFIVLLFLLFLFPAYYLVNFDKDNSYKRPAKKDRIDLAIAFDNDKIRNPYTGTIPIEKLWDANQYTRDLRLLQSQKRSDDIQWDERGPVNVGGRTRAMIMDLQDTTGNSYIAGSVSGGLWRTYNLFDFDNYWYKVDDKMDNLAIGALAQDPVDHTVMYAGTGEGWFNGDAVRGLGVYKSEDGGWTWNRLESTANEDYQYIQDIIVTDSAHVFVATRDIGVMRSKDGGMSWQKVLGSGRFAFSNRGADLEIGPDGSLWATMGVYSPDGIYRSDDHGNTWTYMGGNGFPDVGFRRVAIALAPSDTNRVYAIAEAGNSGECLGIYRSDDKGATWISLEIPESQYGLRFGRNQIWYDLALTVDPEDANHVVIGAVNLFRSKNGGESWQQLSEWTTGSDIDYVHADQHFIQFHPKNNQRLIVGNDGGVFVSYTMHTTMPRFYHRVEAFNVTQFYACGLHPFDSNRIAAGSQDNGTQLFSTPGESFTYEISGGDGGMAHFDEISGDTLVTSYIGNSYTFFVDGQYVGNANFEDGSFVNPTTIIGNTLYGKTRKGNFFRLPMREPFEWERSFVPDLNDGDITHLSVSPNVDNRIYFGLNSGAVYYVDDVHFGSGKNAKEIIRRDGDVSSVSIEKGDEEHIVVTYSNYGVISVWESYDGGDSWMNIEGNLPDMPVRWGIFAPEKSNEFLLATETGLWRTTSLNGSDTEWFPCPDFPNVRCDMIRTHKTTGMVAVATHGRGLFTTDHYKDEFVNNEIIQAEALDISLFPNPVTDFVNIKFDRTVKDLAYRIIRMDGSTIKHGILKDASTIDIRNLPSGNYLISFESENKRATLKLNKS